MRFHFRPAADPWKHCADHAQAEEEHGEGPRAHEPRVPAIFRAWSQVRTDDLACGGAVFVALGCGEGCPVVPRPARAPTARRPEGQAIRGRVQDLGRRAARLVTERARSRGRHGPRSCLARGSETASGEVRHRRTVQHVLWSGQPRGSRRCAGRRGHGTALSSFRGRVSADRGSRCVSGSGPVARSSPSSRWPSRTTLRRPSQGARSAAVRAQGCLHQASLLVGRRLAEVRGLVLATWLLLPHLIA